MLEFERLGPGVGGACVAIFGRAKEPKESDDDEVNDMGVDAAVFCMGGVKDVRERPDDGHVDWVGSAWWVIVVFELFEESSP